MNYFIQKKLYWPKWEVNIPLHNMSPFRVGVSSNGGYNNAIYDCAPASVIGGGCCNTISSPGATTPAVINTILGGTNNCITGNWSVIMGGNNHNLSGCYSAVLGGDSNTDCGFNYVGLTGCGVCGVMPNAFHANTFVVTDMPQYFMPLSINQLYYCDCGTGNCPVFIN